MGDQESLYDPRLGGIVLSSYYSMQGYLAAEIFGSLTRLVKDSELLYDAHIPLPSSGWVLAPSSLQ
jgi:hypothetical protein